MRGKYLAWLVLFLACSPDAVTQNPNGTDALDGVTADLGPEISNLPDAPETDATVDQHTLGEDAQDPGIGEIPELPFSDSELPPDDPDLADGSVDVEAGDEAEGSDAPDVADVTDTQEDADAQDATDAADAVDLDGGGDQQDVDAADNDADQVSPEVDGADASGCGDGACGAGETVDTCPADCQVCGDEKCTAGFENVQSCPADCNICGDGLCTGKETAGSCEADCAKCGDGHCAATEDAANCPVDCACGDGICSEPAETTENCAKDCATCGDGVCGLSEEASYCPIDCQKCGDGLCTGSETTASCAKDCSCGDGVCTAPGESPQTCVKDCPLCGDKNCTGQETFATCPADCPCGDGVCAFGEAKTCGKDCIPTCGNGTCDKAENVATCPEDCVTCGDGHCDGPWEDSFSCLKDCAVCGDGVCGPTEHLKGCAFDCDLTVTHGFCVTTCAAGMVCDMTNGTCMTPACNLPGFWVGDTRRISTWTLLPTAKGCDQNGDGQVDNRLGKVLALQPTTNADVGSTLAAGGRTLLLEAMAWNTTGKPFSLNLLRAQLNPGSLPCTSAKAKCEYDVLPLGYQIASATPAVCAALSKFTATVQGTSLSASGAAWLPVSLVPGQVRDLPFQVMSMQATVAGPAGWKSGSAGKLCGRTTPAAIAAMIDGLPAAALEPLGGPTAVKAALAIALAPDLDTDGDAKADAISAAFGFETSVVVLSGWAP